MAHFHAAKLADLARTAKDVQETFGAAEPVPSGPKPSIPVYPYGTCISLCDNEIASALHGELPPAGAVVHGCFVGIVKASRPPSERIDSDGKKVVEGACVEIEMHELGFAAEDDVDRQLETSQVRQKTWYGGKEPDGDEG